MFCYIKHLDGAQAWIYQRGIYKQLDVYARGEKLFVKSGSSYIRLAGNKSTSIPTMVWLELDGGAHYNLYDNGMKPPTFGASRSPNAGYTTPDRKVASKT